jgi:predicted MFS family arabinose efflux permease
MVRHTLLTNVRRLAPRFALTLIAFGALFLLGEMLWSVWKFHAFTPMFWVLAWMVVVASFILRRETRPPRPNAARRTLVCYAVAFGIALGGWAASPALNAWLQRQ